MAVLQSHARGGQELDKTDFEHALAGIILRRPKKWYYWILDGMAHVGMLLGGLAMGHSFKYSAPDSTLLFVSGLLVSVIFWFAAKTLQRKFG
jgi:hypothetical protein